MMIAVLLLPILITLESEDLHSQDLIYLRHPTDHTKFRVLHKERISEIEPLLVEILKEGELVYDLPDLEAIRGLRDRDLEHLDPGVRRIMNPHIYHVSLTAELWNLKQKLIESARTE